MAGNIFEFGFKRDEGGFTTGNTGIMSLSHVPDSAKAHGYHKPYANDFKQAYERVKEEKIYD